MYPSRSLTTPFGMALLCGLFQGLAPSPLEAQTRVEFHLLPATTTGPMDPDWSPDGRWIAFSMRGDVWKVPAEGGEAIALTAGPDYHFEPDWSPDGRHLAVVVESEGNLDLAWIPAEGMVPGERARRLTTDPRLDLQPEWSPGGDALYFTSGRGGDLDVYRLAIEWTPDGVPRAVGAPLVVAGGPGNQFFPAVSPDGRTLAWVGRWLERLGSGVVWTRPLDDATEPPRIVIDEETSYRTAPRWSPDGSRLLYSTDEAGSSDIALISAGGGQSLRLTEDPLDEFAPAYSADGGRIVFVSNHAGPARLYSLSSDGGPRSAWHPLTTRPRRALRPTGRVTGRVLDASDPAKPTVPARLLVEASDGRAYTEDDGFLRRNWVNDTHYSHVDGEFELELPTGPARVLAMRGLEYLPAEARIDVGTDPAPTVVLSLDRLVDLPARGWYSGDTHSHDLHEGRHGLTQEEFFGFSRADDLHVTNALIHMDGTKWMGRSTDLTGEPFRSSVTSAEDRGAPYLLFYSEEFRGSFGHVALLGLDRFVMPLIGGASGTPFDEDVLKIDHLEAVRRQGGIGGFVHPYNGPTSTPREAASADIVVHVALGLGEFYDVISVASLEWPTLEMYYRFLDCGFRLAATGGTDNFSDAFRDPSPGTARTYAYVPEGLTYDRWLEAVREGRTFATSGPLLELKVEEQLPGGTIERRGSDSPTLAFELSVSSLFPLEAVEVVVNGEVARRFVPPEGPLSPGATTPLSVTFSGAVELGGSGWVAARAHGPPHPLVGDEFPFAHTSPVWVVRDGEPVRSVEDAKFLIETLDALWRDIEERDRFHSEESRARYRDGVARARAVLIERSTP